MARGRSLGEIDGAWPNKLRQVRESKGFSQQQVGEALGISYVQVGRIERGRTKLKDDYRELLAELMGVEPWDFLVDGPDKRTQAALAVSRQLSADAHAAWLAAGAAFVKQRLAMSEAPAAYEARSIKKKRL